MEATSTDPLRLGLIGDNIAASRAPMLHRLAGRLTGRAVRYDRLVPGEMGLTFEQVLARLRDAGYRGVNVTYPYKERAVPHVAIADPLVRAMGAVNTVVFDATGARGFNTDHSGFLRAYRARRGAASAGTVCLVGAGGAGRAVAFALLALGVDTIRCVDRDPERAAALARALAAQGTATRIAVCADPETAARGADGLANCTPLGMVGIGGTPLAAPAMAGATWAFDAVYTPEVTPFLADATARGLDVIPGYDLFLGQGIDAWAIFSGGAVDGDALRAALRRGRG